VLIQFSKIQFFCFFLWYETFVISKPVTNIFENIINKSFLTSSWFLNVSSIHKNKHDYFFYEKKLDLWDSCYQNNSPCSLVWSIWIFFRLSWGRASSKISLSYYTDYIYWILSYLDLIWPYARSSNFRLYDQYKFNKLESLC
jgi:hypothetical protein